MSKWTCPDCDEPNGPQRLVCNRCGRARPEAIQQMAAPEQQHEAVGLLPGQTVTIVNLVQRPDLNGQIAVIDSDAGSNRKHVRIGGSDNLTSIAIPNLRPVENAVSPGYPQTMQQPASGVLKLPASMPPQQPPQPAQPPRASALGAWLYGLLGGKQISTANIVLLGETGSGKTSFLNLLHNFPAVFEDGFKASDGSIRSYHDMKFENNAAKQTESQTSAATLYRMVMADLELKILDTPGFGDTRGMDFDRKHAKMIVDAVKSLDFLHAIVIVISGRTPRMTAQLKFVLSELCAILPKGARHNILTVFTNTSNPLYLSFDIEELGKLVEHTVPPEHQIYIENPFVLHERAAKNKGKVPDAALRDGIAKAFEEAKGNMEKFYKAVASFPQLNTADFEKLYNLRQTIESNTVSVLSEMNEMQKQKQELQKKQKEISEIQTIEKMNENYTRPFSAKRWVMRDADRHGTFCGVKDCHCNCHAPCEMEKTMNNEKFKKCLAFYYTPTVLEVSTEDERRQLLGSMQDKSVRFTEKADSETGTIDETVLCAPCNFSFKGKSFVADAFVAVSGPGNRASHSNFSNAGHLRQARLPCQVTIEDTSDQDTCKECGHHRSYHYHDNKIWVEEDYTEDIVDDVAKKKYFEAKDLKSKKQQAYDAIQKKYDEIERKQRELSQQLLVNIRKFEDVGLTRNYALLLQNQRDLLQQHIESTLETDAGADVGGLREAKKLVEKQLEVVQEAFKQKRNPVQWAHMILGVSDTASLKDVERQYKQLALRMHTDKHGGNAERMKQLTEAVQILRDHKGKAGTGGGLFSGWWS